jgi:GAF domain-containing protein
MLPRIAWAMAGACLLLVVADIAVSAQAVSLLSETAVAIHGFPFVDGAVLGSSIMGALVISRYDRHPIGWLLALVGVTSALSLVTEAYAYWVQEADGPGSAALGGVASWVAAIFGGQTAIAGLALMFLLAPDGHLLSPRWRYAAWLTAFGALLCVSAVITMDPTDFRLDIESDFDHPVRSFMLTVGFLSISGGMAAAVVSTIIRLRRSTGEQRQQVQLIALAASLLGLGIVVLLVVQGFNGGEQTWLSSLPLLFSYFLLPIIFAVAVLRFRLYDVELIINRTVVLVAGTAFAAVGYTTLVVLVGRGVDRQTGGFWVSLLATALVAVAFQPLRRRVVRVADRIAYGSRAQPYQELADFSRRLGEDPSPEALLSTVAAVAGQALAARGATAVLDVPGATAVAARWGSAETGGDVHAVTVRSEGVDLGGIEVVLPRGRRLRPVDARLLEALADQAAVAFRNRALEVQLADRVAQLDRTTRELARSRLRIIEADDAVRRDLETALSREVLPHLLDVAAALDGTGAADPDPDAVDRLVDEVNTALEALRELTRGVFPTQLERFGLEPALRSALAASPSTTVLVDPTAAGHRFDARVEAAVYFCCAEAARADPAPAAVELLVDAGDLLLRITGVGGGGLGLMGITDRVGAAGGSVAVAGDALELRIPVGADSLAPV